MTNAYVEIAREHKLVRPDVPPRGDGQRRSGPPWTPPAFDGATALLDAPRDVPAVWGDDSDVLWSEGEPFLFCGPTGVGKTTVAQQLVLARIGDGHQVLGMSVTPGSGRLLYLACDRPSQAVRSMQRMVDDALRDRLRDRLVFWRGPLPFDIGKGDPGRLAELTASYGADTLVIDSLKDVAMKLTDDEVGARVNAALQHVLEVAEVAPLHHLRKAQSGQRQPQSIDELYGSVWMPAGAGSVVVLWGEPGDAIVDLTHLKQPRDVVGPLKVRHDHDTGRSTVIAEPDALDIVRATPRGVTVAGVARIMHDTTDPDRNQVERARRRLDRLVARGLATKRQAPDGRAGGTTPTLYVPVDDRRQEPS